MGSLRDYFEADYNYALSVHRSRTFSAGDMPFETVERLHQDFRSNAKFISYYIPGIEHPLALSEYIMAHPEWGLSVADGVLVWMGHQGEEMTSGEGLVFTNQFIFYIDQPLPAATIAAIRHAGASRGFVVQVRGREHVERQEALRLAAIADKVGGPDSLAALLVKVEEFEALLTTATREEEAHQFLKANPSVLGLTSVIDPISKFRLGSDYVTDFVLDEIPYGYVLVEIEKATTRLFKKSSPFERTQELNHAIEQVEHWRAWVARNHSYIASKLRGISPTPLCWVIAGRSRDMNEEQKARLAQINEQQRGTYAVLTYDDLLARLKVVLGRIGSTMTGRIRTTTP
jgi:hypothetical protein